MPVPRWRASSRASRSVSGFLMFSAMTSPSVSIEMALLVVAEDFIIRAIVQEGTTVETLGNLIDAAYQLFLVFPPRSRALPLDLFAQGVGDGFCDAGAAPARELAGKLLGLCVLDVQCHGDLCQSKCPCS